MSWTCECGRDFGSARARMQHMDALGHSIPTHECDRCPRNFNSHAAAVQHMNAVNHWRHECDICDETWPSAEDVKQHEVDEHYYCSDCNRAFQNHNNIKMHLNSRIHRGTNMQCPFCKQHYATATGLSHHLESGGCPNAPSLDHDKVFEIVRHKDPNGLISKKMIGWEGSPKYQATPEAWNGIAYECYFCHRNFRTLHALNQHLASPTHQQNLYHCPNRAGCSKDFTTLAAVMNHLESESCGFTRFERVQRSVQGLVSSDRLIRF